MSLRHRFVVRTASRDSWRALYGPDDELHEVAVVLWTVELVFPELTRERMARNLNAGGRAPRRTWSAAPRSEFQWSLRHNGREVGEVTWDGSVRRVEEWMRRIVASLNEDRGKADPFPEPKPPLQRRDWDYEPGDHDHRTGKDVAA